MLDQSAADRRSGRAVPRARSRTRSRPACSAACSSRSWASATSARSTGTTSPQLQKYLAHGPRLRRAGAAARGDREGARLPAGRRGPDVVPRARRRSRAKTARSCRSRSQPAARLHRGGPRRDPRADASRPARRGDHRRHVPGQHARAGPRRVSRAVLRRGHLRVARRGLRRRAGQGRAAADRRHLQHLPAAELRPDLPGSGPAEPAGDAAAGPRRAGRARRADAPRRVRPGLPAAVAEPGRDGPRRRSRRGADARLRAGARRPDGDPLSQGRGRDDRPREPAPIELGTAEVLRLGPRRHDRRLRHAAGRVRRGGRAAARARASTSASSTPGSSSRSTPARSSGPWPSARSWSRSRKGA